MTVREGDAQNMSLSVIIPTFNRAMQLPAAVDSIMRQTRPVDQIVIVDDGSEDNTREVVMGLSGPIQYLRQPNRGVSEARNRGLEAATGEFIAFVDTDDQWDPRKVELQLAVLERFPEAGWSATNLQVVDEADDSPDGLGGLERAVPVFRDVGMMPGEWFGSRLEKVWINSFGGEGATAYVGDAFGLLLNGNFVFPSTMMVRRSCMEEVGLFDPDFLRAGDNEYALRLAAAQPVALIDLPLTRYRRGSVDQLTNSAHTEELIRNALESLNRASGYRDDLSEYEQRSLRRGKELLYLRQAYEHLSNLNGAAARNSVGNARVEAGRVGLKGATIFLASFFPSQVLQSIAGLRRTAIGLGPSERRRKRGPRDA